jgi:hypothetical protein
LGQTHLLLQEPAQHLDPTAEPLHPLAFALDAFDLCAQLALLSFEDGQVSDGNFEIVFRLSLG